MRWYSILSLAAASLAVPFTVPAADLAPASRRFELKTPRGLTSSSYPDIAPPELPQ